MTFEAKSKESPADDLANLLHARWSCRAFLPNEISRGDIERLLTLAGRTPSWCNTQPWHVTLVTGRALETFRTELLGHVDADGERGFDFDPPAEYRGVHAERRRAAGSTLYKAVGVTRGDLAMQRAQSRENFRLFGAPHLAVISTDRSLGVYGAIDCGGYVSNFLLAAESCGISAIPQAALASYSGFLRRYFKIGDDRKIVCGISFGLADRKHPANNFRTERADIAETTTWCE